MTPYKDILEALSRVDFLSKSIHNRQFIEDLISSSKKVYYKAGRTIIKEDQKGSEMYVGISGSVEIQKLTRAGDKYTISHVHCRDGIYFGEFSLIDDDTRSATVHTLENSCFLKISQKTIHKLCEKYPQEGYIIMKGLAVKLVAQLRKVQTNFIHLFDALLQEIQ